MAQLSVARSVDEEELLVRLVGRIVYRAVLVGASGGSNWEIDLNGERCLGCMSEGSLATFQLRYC